MTERERMIEVVAKAFSFLRYGKKSVIEDFADSLIEYGVIVPPVKIGDTVWDNDFGYPESYTVTGFDIGKTMDDEIEHKEVFVYCQKRNGSVTWRAPASMFGKIVFLTREEAEKVLAERKIDL